MTSTPPAPEALLAVFDRYLASWNDGDESARRALFADDVIAEDPVGSPAMEGIEAWVRFWREGVAPGTKLRMQRLEFIACGWEALAVFSAEILPSGGEPIVMRVHETLEFDSQLKIRRLKAYWNRASVRSMEKSEELTASGV